MQPKSNVVDISGNPMQYGQPTMGFNGNMAMGGTGFPVTNNTGYPGMVPSNFGQPYATVASTTASNAGISGYGTQVGMTPNMAGFGMQNYPQGGMMGGAPLASNVVDLSTGGVVGAYPQAQGYVNNPSPSGYVPNSNVSWGTSFPNQLNPNMYQGNQPANNSQYVHNAMNTGFGGATAMSQSQGMNVQNPYGQQNQYMQQNLQSNQMQNLNGANLQRNSPVVAQQGPYAAAYGNAQSAIPQWNVNQNNAMAVNPASSMYNPTTNMPNNNTTGYSNPVQAPHGGGIVPNVASGASVPIQQQAASSAAPLANANVGTPSYAPAATGPSHAPAVAAGGTSANVIPSTNTAPPIPTPVAPGIPVPHATTSGAPGVHDASRSAAAVENDLSDHMAAVSLDSVAKEAAAYGRRVVPSEKATVVDYGGAGADVKHSYTKEEVHAFAQFFNDVLANDLECKGRIPIPVDSEALFDAVRDGYLLCRLALHTDPSVLNPAQLKSEPKTQYDSRFNLIMALEASRSLGSTVVNASPGDFLENRRHIVLGVIWQLVRAYMLRNVNVGKQPQLVKLLKPEEDPAMFAKMTPEDTLLRWFNSHLEAQGSSRRVTNFGVDLKDSECYEILLSSLAPAQCPGPKPFAAGEKESIPALVNRGETMLQHAAGIGCRKYVTPDSIASGRQPHLNVMYTALLFDKYMSVLPASVRAASAAKDAEIAAKIAEATALQSRLEEAERRLAEADANRKRYAAEAAAESAARLAAQQAEYEARMKAMQEEALKAQQRVAADEAQSQRDAAARAAAERDAALRREYEQRMLMEQQRAMMEQQQLQQLWMQQQAAEQARLDSLRQSSMAYQTAAPVGGAYRNVVTKTTTVAHTTEVAGLRLCVTVQQARALAHKSGGLTSILRSGNPDPVCILSIGGNRWSTTSSKSTIDPVWNKEFEIPRVDETTELKFNIWNREPSGKVEDFLGELILRRKDLADGLRNWFPLSPRVGYPDHVSGELFLSFRVLPML